MLCPAWVLAAVLRTRVSEWGWGSRSWTGPGTAGRRSPCPGAGSRCSWRRISATWGPRRSQSAPGGRWAAPASHPATPQTSNRFWTLIPLALYKIFFLGQSTLEKPHDDDVLGEGDGVVVELEGVGVGQGDGEHWQELLRAEAGEHLRQRDERGEELQHGDGDEDRGRDLGQVEQHLRQICSLHYSITTSK